jgi:hypothetical protein
MSYAEVGYYNGRYVAVAKYVFRFQIAVRNALCVCEFQRKRELTENRRDCTRGNTPLNGFPKSAFEDRHHEERNVPIEQSVIEH